VNEAPVGLSQKVTLDRRKTPPSVPRRAPLWN